MATGSSIIPARFLTTIGHLIAVIMVFFSKVLVSSTLLHSPLPHLLNPHHQINQYSYSLKKQNDNIISGLPPVYTHSQYHSSDSSYAPLLPLSFHILPTHLPPFMLIGVQIASCIVLDNNIFGNWVVVLILWNIYVFCNHKHISYPFYFLFFLTNSTFLLLPLNTCTHTLACIFLSFFILDRWHYKNMWYIFGFLR